LFRFSGLFDVADSRENSPGRTAKASCAAPKSLLLKTFVPILYSSTLGDDARRIAANTGLPKLTSVIASPLSRQRGHSVVSLVSPNEFFDLGSLLFFHNEFF
jgi:hypothetical protein